LKTSTRLLGLASLALLGVTPGWSAGNATQVSTLVVTKLSGTMTTITDENFLSTDPLSGTKKTPFKGEDLMVDPDNNQLVLVLTTDWTFAEGNFSHWTLEEWTTGATPAPFDRDAVTGGVQSQILIDEDDYGRAFITKRLKDPANLKHAAIQATSDLMEADASRFGAYPLGDHFGYLTFKGHLDKEGTGTISDIAGTLTFQADILKLPQDDFEQVSFVLKIKAAKKL
jgi:hypothetical protein